MFGKSDKFKISCNCYRPDVDTVNATIYNEVGIDETEYMYYINKSIKTLIIEYTYF